MQTTNAKERVYSQAVAFFSTNDTVLTALKASFTGMFGLNESTQTVNAMKEGVSRSIEVLSEIGDKVQEAAIRSGYGPDVRTLDEALAKVFALVRVAPRKIAVCGFSDGASYALGLGISNGDLFRSIMAFSPGFIPQGVSATGSPRIFISHGTRDQILPIDSCSRRLVPQLKQAGLNVRFKEFDGPHAMPPEIAREAIEWFLK